MPVHMEVGASRSAAVHRAAKPYVSCRTSRNSSSFSNGLAEPARPSLRSSAHRPDIKLAATWSDDIWPRPVIGRSAPAGLIDKSLTRS